MCDCMRIWTCAATPLHLAASNGHAWCCTILIAAGAHVDAQGGPQHMTPLHLAALGGHTQAVRVLLDEDADVNLLDKWVVFL